jgi:hypothetical protein
MMRLRSRCRGIEEKKARNVRAFFMREIRMDPRVRGDDGRFVCAVGAFVRRGASTVSPERRSEERRWCYAVAGSVVASCKRF